MFERTKKLAIPISFVFFLLFLFSLKETSGAENRSTSSTAQTFNQQKSPSLMEKNLISIRDAQRKGDLKRAILLAADILGSSETQGDVSEVYLILGDMYLSSGSIQDALNYYALAAGGKEQDATNKIQSALEVLPAKDLMCQLSGEGKPLIMGHLLYQLGLKYLEDGKTEDAKKAFSELVSQYPEHPFHTEAVRKIDIIENMSGYDGATIGVVLPLTGPYSFYGRRALKGIKLALNEHNAVGSNTLRIVLKDTGSELSKAVSMVHTLCEQNIAAIIGPMGPGKEAALEAQKSGVPVFVLTQAESITDIGDFVFRNYLTPMMQVDTLVSYAVDQLGVRRFAIMYPDETYGHEFEKYFRKGVNNYGAKLVRSVSYLPTQTDFRNTINAPTNGAARSPAGSSWDKDGPAPIDFEAVFIPDSSKMVALIAPQLYFYDIEDVLLMGTNLWCDSDLIPMAGKYIQNAIFAKGFLPESSQTVVQNFVSSFSDTYGEAPDFVSAVAFDTTKIICEILSDNSVKSHSDFKKGLLNIRLFTGATGITSIDEDGRLWKKTYLLQVVGDQIVSLDEQTSITIDEKKEQDILKVGTYNVIVEEDEMLFETDMDGIWLIPEEDRIFFSHDDQGVYRIYSDKDGRFIQVDNGRKFYTD